MHKYITWGSVQHFFFGFNFHTGTLIAEIGAHMYMCQILIDVQITKRLHITSII